MPANAISIEISASSNDVFELIHDYSRRLDWDPFLRKADLLDGALTAEVGVSSRCVARWLVGGMAMDTVNVTFSPPEVAAVSMIRGPWFLSRFAASIRQDQLNRETVRVTYRYNFKVRPRVLAWLVEPIVGWVFRRETTRRLAALKQYFEESPRKELPV